jgi:hypothetical protein
MQQGMGNVLLRQPDGVTLPGVRFNPRLVHCDYGEACAAIHSEDSVDGFGESLAKVPSSTQP